MKDYVSNWQAKIISGEKGQKEWRDKFKVDLAREYFEGAQRPDHIPADEWINLNMIYAHLLAQLPALYALDPYFYINLTKSYELDPMKMAQWESNAEIRQSLLNYIKKEQNLKVKARLAIQDAHFAFGVIKTHYIADIKDNPKAGQAIVDEMGDPVLDEDGQEILHPDTIPLNGSYQLTRVHPDNLILPHDASPLEDDWPWVIERIPSTVADLNGDKRFNKKAVRESINKIQSDRKGDSDINDDPVNLYEIYNIKTNEFMLISHMTKTPLIDKQPIPKGIERHPYSILRFTFRDNSPYPIPPMSQGLDPQREYNELRSKLLVHRKRFNRKYEAFVQGFEDPDTELSKLETGEDGTILRTLTPTQVVRSITDAPLDQQNYQDLALLKNDMNELFGSTDTARGVSGADSATEASIMDKRLDIKEGDRQSIVVDWLNVVAKKLDQLAQCHLTQEMAVKVKGPDGEQWVAIKPENYDDINGEYDYTVDVGSMQPRLPSIERAQWIAFMSQVVIPMPIVLTKPKLMERMAKMFGIEDKAMLDEFREVGNQIMNSQGAAVNNPGSQAGVPEYNPVGAVMGQQNGLLGGNVNGGGSQIQQEVV